LDPVAYPYILHYSDELFFTYQDSVDAVIYDPPYAPVSGGHNATNCVMSKSCSRIKFNHAYGVDYKYDTSQIHHFYVKGFEIAGGMLRAGGIVMMKVMNLEDLAMRDNLVAMANLCGFVLYGKHYSLVKTNSLSVSDDAFSDIGFDVIV
jgi:hypothetical protein